jgi:hypothetical protein
MLEKIFGSKNREKVLFYILGRKEGYAREIAVYYNSSLSPIQKQLDNLEAASVLASKLAGKTRIYFFNARYPFINELTALLKKAIDFLPKDERDKLLINRTRPRRRGKPL